MKGFRVVCHAYFSNASLELLLNFDLHFNIHGIIVENLRVKGAQGGVVFTRRVGARVSNLLLGPVDHVTHACKQTLTPSPRISQRHLFCPCDINQWICKSRISCFQSAFCLHGKRKLLALELMSLKFGMGETFFYI